MASSSSSGAFLLLLLSLALLLVSATSRRSLAHSPLHSLATAAAVDAEPAPPRPTTYGPIATNGRNYSHVCDPRRFADLGLRVADFAYCDKKLPYEERVKSLVGSLSLQEKVGQLGDQAPHPLPLAPSSTAADRLSPSPLTERRLSPGLRLPPRRKTAVQPLATGSVRPSASPADSAPPLFSASCPLLFPSTVPDPSPSFADLYTEDAASACRRSVGASPRHPADVQRRCLPSDPAKTVSPGPQIRRCRLHSQPQGALISSAPIQYAGPDHYFDDQFPCISATEPVFRCCRGRRSPPL